MTLSQSPSAGCRNRRADGYHGLSVRPVSQRKSAEYGKRIKRGMPIAPARWAGGVCVDRDQQVELGEQARGIGKIFQVVAHMNKARIGGQEWPVFCTHVSL